MSIETSRTTFCWNSYGGILFGLLFTLVVGYLGYSINGLHECVPPTQSQFLRFDFWLEVWSDTCMIFSVVIATIWLIPKCRSLNERADCRLIFMMFLDIFFFLIQIISFLVMVVISLSYMNQICMGKDATMESLLIIGIWPFPLVFSTIRIVEIDNMRNAVLFMQELGIMV